ncbi:MAG: DUF2284 domain-containing protein [Proteobacteria bacterium]|nr:DUF2284 domain-containing protein [Pseudomonadota bacterium]
MARQIRKISLDCPETQIESDLEKYRLQALDLGASQATVVRVESVPVDERVPLKCQIPRCFGYGTGAHCPPNTLKPAELKEILKKYNWAVFFIKDVPSDVIVRDKATIKERVEAYQNVYHIVNQVESAAFYDGHYLAFGFAAGSCRHTFCGQLETCQAMTNGRCRHSLRARPSMEAVGIDVYRLTASVGWDIYPIGSDCRPDEVPKGTLAGIIIVE